jgi:hypothetical protein
MRRNEYIFFIIALLAVVAFFSFKSNERVKQVKSSYETVLKYKEIEKQQLIKSDSLKAVEIKTIAQNQVSYADAIKHFEKEIKGFKRAQSLVKSEILTEIKGLSLDYDSTGGKFDGISINDSLYIHKDTVDAYFIRVPKNIDYSDDWLSFNATVDHKFKLDSLKTLNKLDIVIGYKKQEKPLSFLRKKDPVVELKSYSPYSSVPYVNNVVFKEEKSKVSSIFTSRAAFFGYGFITSTVLNKL